MAGSTPYNVPEVVPIITTGLSSLLILPLNASLLVGFLFLFGRLIRILFAFLFRLLLELPLEDEGGEVWPLERRRSGSDVVGRESGVDEAYWVRCISPMIARSSSTVITECWVEVFLAILARLAFYRKVMFILLRRSRLLANVQKGSSEIGRRIYRRRVVVR